MALDAWKLKCSEPEVTCHVIRAVGTGASAPTKVYGKGVTITRTGAGDYRLTWGDNPGVFLGAVASLQAATESDVSLHTVVLGSWSASGLTLDMLVDDGTAADDLEASEWVTVTAFFARTTP